MFFLFKQKTAYEMRISDWSSDVCSSDLTGSRRTRRSSPARRAPVGRWSGGTRRTAGRSREGRVARGSGRPARIRARGASRPACRRTDRKSVVEGKSVSVRVDLGGGRSIKKNNIRHRINKELTILYQVGCSGRGVLL